MEGGGSHRSNSLWPCSSVQASDRAFSRASSASLETSAARRSRSRCRSARVSSNLTDVRVCVFSRRIRG